MFVFLFENIYIGGHILRFLLILALESSIGQALVMRYLVHGRNVAPS